MKISFVKRLLPAAILTSLLFLLVCHLRAQDAGATKVDAGRQDASENQSSEQGKQEEDENDKYLHSSAVRALGAKAGLNAEQAATAFTVANFVVLAALVGWFLAKTLPKTFRDRNTTIQKQLVDARTATEDANARLRSVEDRLSKLDSQIAAMRRAIIGHPPSTLGPGSRKSCREPRSRGCGGAHLSSGTGSCNGELQSRT